MKPNRKTSERWMAARLRRLDAKLKGGPCRYRDMSSESLEQCRVRAHRLACDLQAIWSKREAERRRTQPKRQIPKLAVAMLLGAAMASGMR